MKRKMIISLLMVLALIMEIGMGISKVYANSPTWEAVGSKGFSLDSSISYISFEIHNGTPYISFRTASHGPSVMKYNGASWEAVGSRYFSDGSTGITSMAIYNGTPYVAYKDGANGDNATVMKYNGTSWEVVGSKGFSEGDIGGISIAIYNGTPYVFYNDNANSQKATVMKYNGTSWEVVGSKGFSDGSAGWGSIEIYNGTPYVAYKDGANGDKATVMKYNGTSWEVVGSKGFSEGKVAYLSFALDNGTPYVAYLDYANSQKATVMKYNGTSWEAVGNKGISDGNIGYNDIVIHNGTPYVTYYDYGINEAIVKKYNEESWEVVGGKWFSDTVAGFPSLAFDNGTPYVAYTDDANHGRATVLNLNHPPIANNVSISGNTIIEDTLTGSYDYSDAESDVEGTTTFQWYRADDNSGTNKTAITGASNQTYVVQEADLGKYISFEVRPVALEGATPGTVKESSYVGPMIKLSNNANLKSLTLSDGEISFNSNTTNYDSIEVANDVTTLTIEAIPEHENASVTIDGTATTLDTISLEVGSNNKVPIVVTAEDGNTKKTYNLTITRLKSSNADLRYITLSSGTLNTTFDADTLNYTANVDHSINEVEVTAIPVDPNATVKVNGSTTSDTITLNVGSTEVPIVVTAEDGTTKKYYSVTVNRAKSGNVNLADLSVSPGSIDFSKTKTSYQVDVNQYVLTITISAQAEDKRSMLTFNEKTAGPTVTTSDSIYVTADTVTISDTVPLQKGLNQFDILVTAQDGGTKTYTVNVNRAYNSNALLESLVVNKGTLTPSFNANTNNYTVNVSHTISNITVDAVAQDPNATLTINGETTKSKTLSLLTGQNVVNISVTAEDGTTKNMYQVVIHRESNENDDKHDVKGTVGEKDPNNPEGTSRVVGATVKIYKGNVQVGTTGETDEDGKFTVQNIPDGNYNLVVTKGDRTITVYVEVRGQDYEFSDIILLPEGNKNSVLKIQGNTTPSVVVDGLHELYDETDIFTDDDKGIIDDGGEVEILLNVEPSIDQQGKSVVEAAMEQDGATTGILLDVDLSKTIVDTKGIKTSSKINDTRRLMKLYIPLPSDIQGKDNYVVYRAHDFGNGLTSDKITTSPNSSGEYISVNDEKTELTLYARYFSTYAISYSEDTGDTGSDSDSDSDSKTNEDKKYFKMIAEAINEGGSISPAGIQNVTEGADLTYTIHAEEGYEILNVLVDGESVGRLTSYTFTDIDLNHTISVEFKKVERIQVSFHKAYIIGYEDDTFKPSKSITRAEIAAIIARNLGYKDSQKGVITSFPDVKSSHWAAGVIKFVKLHKLMNGDDKSNFNPDSPITRAEMATIVARYRELELLSENDSMKAFPDIYGHWAMKEIAANKQAGFISGYPDGHFKPNGKLTRAEALKIMNRMFDRGPLYGVTKSTFKDVSLAHWAYNEIEEAAQDHYYTTNPDGGENIIK